MVLTFCTLENGKVKITKTGVYELLLNVQFSNNATGVRQILLQQNKYFNCNAVSGFPTRVQVSDVAGLDRNAIISAKAFQTSGTDLTLTADITRLTIRRISGI